MFPGYPKCSPAVPACFLRSGNLILILILKSFPFRPGENLDPDLESWLASSNDTVVYFSFGSAVQPELLTPATLTMFEKVALMVEVTLAGVRPAAPARHLEEVRGVHREDADEGLGGPAGRARPPQGQHLHLPSRPHEPPGGVNAFGSMPLSTYRGLVVVIVMFCNMNALCEI